MRKEIFRKMFLEIMENKDNKFHPLVWINGNPKIGNNVFIGGFSEVNAGGSSVEIGDNCDIASFVAINVADSHKKVLGISKEVERGSIIIENNVFIGSHCFIGRDTKIGHHSVIGAGSIIQKMVIPPYSLVIGNPFMVKEGYYAKK